MKQGPGIQLQQVVNGESVVFDKRETVMRRDAAILRRARPIVAHEQPLVCATVNCERVRMAGSRYCPDCGSEVPALDAWAADAKMQRRARRLRTFGLVLLFVGLMSALGFFGGAAVLGR